jgi:FtsH-binding integral membrane protein
MEKNDVDFMRIGSRLLPLFILTLLLLFGILLTPSNQQIPLHLMWLGFIILMSVSGYPIYLLAKQEQILNKVLITLGIIFLSMSYLAYTNRFEFLQGYSSYFTFGLLGLIVFQSLDLIFSDYNKGQDTRFWYYSIFAIVLFSGLLIYDTQKIIKEASVLETICKNRSHLECANYPEKSISIFLDLLNLFNNLTNVYRNRG